MNITEKEEKQLYEWGIKFFEMGWEAAFKFITTSSSFALPAKSEAIRKYIESELKK